jgi:hypothetical protein
MSENRPPAPLTLPQRSGMALDYQEPLKFFLLGVLCPGDEKSVAPTLYSAAFANDGHWNKEGYRVAAQNSDPLSCSPQPIRRPQEFGAPSKRLAHAALPPGAFIENGTRIIFAIISRLTRAEQRAAAYFHERPNVGID